MKIRAYERFRRCYRDLPVNIQKKIDKQVTILSEDFLHPSLHTKKIQGAKGIWECRIDIKYRFTFEIIEDTIFLRTAGNHDDVLKNP